MTSIPHESAEVSREKRGWPFQLVADEAWACLAIIVMWITVLIDAVFGPDIVSTTVGGTSSTIPSAVAVALFAFLGTWVVARYGFGHKRQQ